MPVGLLRFIEPVVPEGGGVGFLRRPDVAPVWALALEEEPVRAAAARAERLLCRVAGTLVEAAGFFSSSLSSLSREGRREEAEAARWRTDVLCASESHMQNATENRIIAALNLMALLYQENQSAARET